jgi:hypothetical protein
MNLLTPSRATLVTALINEAAALTGLSAKKIHTLESVTQSDWPALRARAAIMTLLREEYQWEPQLIAEAFRCEESPVYKNTRITSEKRRTPEFKTVYAHLRTKFDSSL